MKRKLLSYFFLQENGAKMNTLFGTKKNIVVTLFIFIFIFKISTRNNKSIRF